MRSVRVFYRHEADGAWIATSPEVPGFVGHGNSYEETRDRVQEGLPWFAEDEDLLMAHIQDEQVDQRTSGLRVSFTMTKEPKLLPSYFGRADALKPTG